MDDYNTDSLFEVPMHFIKEYSNKWTIIVIVGVAIYFIILRTYYIKREQFYDETIQLKEMEDLQNTENELLYLDTKEPNDNDIQSNSKHEPENKPKHKSKNKAKSIKPPIGEDNTKLRGVKVFEGFESFAAYDPTSTQYQSPSSTPTNTNLSPTNPAPTNPSPTPTSPSEITSTISTTLFDELNLNESQIQSCKNNYNQVIATYISDLTKLVKLKKSNEYLNVKKQFDTILSKGIDNITNYLSNRIRSLSILTRTSIRTEVINSLTNTIEILIDKTNNDITAQMNNLAILNSTSIDYNTMLSKIDIYRKVLEDYIEVDKLVATYGNNLSNYNREVNNILNKSFVLPIYERNFDKINQLIKSDYNDNETNLANKYGRAYTDFLNEKKKEELDINPLRLASKIESGIVNMLSEIGGGSGGRSGKRSNTNKENTNKYRDVDYDDDDDNGRQIIEQSNPIPEQSSKLVHNTRLNSGANIYEDRGNTGNYLVDKKTQKQMLEGFAVGGESDTTTSLSSTSPSSTSPSSTSPSSTSPSTTKSNPTTTNANGNKDIMSKLLSGDFLQYIMEVVNEKINMLYGAYNKKYGSGSGSGSGSSTDSNYNTKFNLEENMIPAGFLLFILSMLIYFVDTTS